MLEKYLAEAFQSLSSLTEDVVDINDEDVESKVSDITDDETDDSNHNRQDENLDGERLNAFGKHFDFAKECPRKSADNTGKDYQGDSVTNTLCRNSLAEIHDKDGSCGEGKRSK